MSFASKSGLSGISDQLGDLTHKGGLSSKVIQGKTVSTSLKASALKSSLLKTSWSQEQEHILGLPLDRFCVVALAGCGKTKTGCGFIERHGYKKWNYFTFNQSMALEVSSQLPQGVKAMTMHGKVFQYTGVLLAHKLQDLQQEKTLEKIASYLHHKPRPELSLPYARLVVQTILHYCWSTSIHLSPEHIPGLMWFDYLRHPEQEIDLEKLMKDAENLWHHQTNPHHLAPCSHDHYVKLAQLKHIRFAHPSLVDEAQDFSPCMLDIIRQQEEPYVLMGDPYQSLYGFRGACGQFMGMDRVYALTGSYRFDEHLASWSNMALKGLGAEWFLKGQASHGGVCQMMPSPSVHETILTFTNARSLHHALEAQAKGWSIKWIQKPPIHSMERIQALSSWREHLTQPPKHVWGFKQYDQYAEWMMNHPVASEEQQEIECLEKWSGHGTWNQTCILDPVKSHVSEDENKPWVEIGTVHQSKGLTRSAVYVDEEVLLGVKKNAYSYAESTPDSVLTLPVYPKEAWIRTYVALTRAQHQLSLSPVLFKQLQQPHQLHVKPQSCFEEHP